MVKKSFKVTVDGETFNVEVEETGRKKDVDRIVQKPIEINEPVKQEERDSVAFEDKKVTSSPKETLVQEPKTDVTGTTVTAPMPGAIVDVKVKEGDVVAQDDVLVILEAMKMENEITSPVAGTVLKVMVNKGASVNSKESLMIIG